MEDFKLQIEKLPEKSLFSRPKGYLVLQKFQYDFSGWVGEGGTKCRKITRTIIDNIDDNDVDISMALQKKCWNHYKEFPPTKCTFTT